IHEATHGYQFLKGYMSQVPVQRGTDIFNYSNDKQRWALEAQAYQWQYSFSGPYPPGTILYVPNYDAIVIDFVSKVTTSDGKPLYAPLTNQ
ncbi:MAG TPA: hypothetical protein VHA52_05575, partial [Candidatus Babeliaceae bacterium]|nr:hypothetical protein [Candidatus Babeliaceae bacterium]